ncbi:uncharacterized protein LOC113219164 [Apis mellifera]|uniref:Uncharacterized protein LOC113219164 n=1 Tax=Apis mellifera TaxID=7460 RepID=A0A7M7MSB9_APIME|nr:uncharacterized protein LOC113219164 [Apis mellifera]|eukprot:XP_026300258.1 uncharacterized protein LOC113219164 [Apis mellifera]
MDDQYQQRMRNIMVAYNVIAIFFALWIQTMDMYHSWGNIRACLFSTSNTLSLILPLLKIFILLCHKQDFFRLVLYMKRNFLQLRRSREKDRDRLQPKVHLLHLLLHVSYDRDYCLLHGYSTDREYWEKRVGQSAPIQHVG